MTSTPATRLAFARDLSDPRHGTRNGYDNLRCRCASCRGAWARVSQEKREKRVAALAGDDARHGLLSTYFNHACRCPRCKEARRLYKRKSQEEGEVTVVCDACGARGSRSWAGEHARAARHSTFTVEGR